MTAAGLRSVEIRPTGQRRGIIKYQPRFITRKGNNVNFSQTIEEKREEILKTEANIAFAQELAHLEAAGVVDWGIFDYYIYAYIAPGNSYKSIRKAMGKGWRKRNSHISEKGDIFVNFEDIQGRRLVIIIDASLAAATCEKVQVGVVEQPVYRVVCH